MVHRFPARSALPLIGVVVVVVVQDKFRLKFKFHWFIEHSVCARTAAVGTEQSEGGFATKLWTTRLRARHVADVEQTNKLAEMITRTSLPAVRLHNF